MRFFAPLGPALSLIGSLLLTASIALGLGACSGSPEREEEKPIEARRTLRKYHGIYLLRAGDRRTDRHLGFLGETYTTGPDGEEALAYYVYDTYFRPIGFYYSDGSTYQFEKGSSDYENIGSFDVNRSLEVLFGVEGTFNFQEGLRR